MCQAPWEALCTFLNYKVSYSKGRSASEGDMVNERAVYILLECILVSQVSVTHYVHRGGGEYPPRGSKRVVRILLKCFLLDY